MTASESVLAGFTDAKDRPKVGRWSWRRIEIVIEGATSQHNNGCRTAEYTDQLSLTQPNHNKNKIPSEKIKVIIMEITRHFPPCVHLENSFQNDMAFCGVQH